jgi:hypothetical protein
MTDSNEPPGRAGYQAGMTIAKQRKLVVIVLIVIAALVVISNKVGEHLAATQAKERAAAAAASQARIEANRAARLKATADDRASARSQMAAAIAKKDYEAAISAGAMFADLSDPEAKGRLAEIQAKEAKIKAELDRKADLARRKREGVKIGMTQQQVIESSWGKPSDINRTSTARGTREQWVYSDGRGYLYFDNGILTTVQN